MCNFMQRVLLTLYCMYLSTIIVGTMRLLPTIVFKTKLDLKKMKILCSVLNGNC